EPIGDRSTPPPYEVDPRTSLVPSTHLLSNGQYSVMMTASGSGYSTWNNIAISRWREDPTSDDWGSFIFLRDISSNKVWSAGYAPAVALPESYKAAFSEEKIEIHRIDGFFTTTLECLVSNEDNAEARRVIVVNNSSSPRVVEMTTYLELALATAASDSAHPAFSKLFVTTEYVAELETLLATRRRRSPSEPEIWAAQFMLADGKLIGQLEFETDRAKFLGQGNELRSAQALAGGASLTGTKGTVLDPVFSLRRRLRIPAGQQASCTLWTVVAESRSAVLDMVDRHRQHAAYERAQILAWSHSRIQLRHLSVDPTDASLFQRLASHLIYAGPTMRPPSQVLQTCMRAQPNLWSQGISGTKPILLVRVDAVEDLEIVRQLLRAHEYWNAKQLAVDLVILNDRRASYIQDLQGAIEELIRKNRVEPERMPSSTIGQVFAVRADLMAQETLTMLPAVARVVLHARGGTLASQMLRLRVKGSPPSPLKQPLRLVASRLEKPLFQARDGLSFFNGFGGFDGKQNEYVIVHDHGNPTPAPWINVIANSGFGMQCTGEGPGSTWSGNSRECQITPWSNDFVSNRPAEAIYIRDDRSGAITSPRLAPLRSGHGEFRTRHGFGYTVYEADDADLSMELMQCVPLTDTLKIEQLRIVSSSPAARQLTVTFFADLVLGAQRAATAPFVTTEIDSETGALFVRNRWNQDFGERVVFFDFCGSQSAWSGDRQHFMGRYGNLSSPRAVSYGENLSNTTGGGLDPCAALQQKVVVSSASPGEVRILVGSAANDAEARALIARYRKTDFGGVLADVKTYWHETLGAVEVKTPDASFDLMLNGWLLYQTLACRMFGRAGFYQASGAYGFRDQLQDSMAITTVRPEISREHILRAASRQFLEGDLQHWWLPASGVGVRTRISDDTVWLAYCVQHYVAATGDLAILDEAIPFIEGRALEAGEHDAYYQPSVSGKTATLYEHCTLALDLSLAAGDHGLPLIGTGDWNDGMNRVGEHGKGESVWLGWFLYATLKSFEPIAAARNDTTHVDAWKKRMASLKQALNTHGWDGNWYRRGYFDDGTPLGSAQNSECRIDAIAQSWAVLSGAAKPERAEAALAQSYENLVKPDDGVAMLFTPPFDTSMPDPGYVKSYPPGIRENGGQYTHGAIWSIFAHAKLGQADKSAQLFSLLNPVNHALNQADALRYRVEPYVVAADVYSVTPHAGRGGWTWYTGAAGWLYRAGIEAILGFRREGNKLRVKPCIPGDWSEFSVHYKFGSTRYEFIVARYGFASPETSDIIKKISDDEYLVSLRDTGGTMRVRLTIGAKAANTEANMKRSQASA
ncbi:MAG TPA: glycosyl transferase, partial [Aestuariivirga sp.]|nr:glycosyl transferase [Aestuariivirga sp.]